MTRSEVLRLLRRHKATLARRFGVIELALYGSFARDRGSDDSDVDILVRFEAPPDWKRYFGAQAYLEDVLGRPVDMATSREVRAETPLRRARGDRCLTRTGLLASGASTLRT